MERTTKKTALEVDLTKPLPPIETDANDCFGKLYDNTVGLCAICACNEICANLSLKHIAEKAKALSPIPYLDEIDMEAASDKALTEYCEANNGQPVSSLVEFITNITKCTDSTTIIQRIQRFKEVSQLKVKGGKIVW